MQIFRRSTNSIARFSIFGSLFVLAGLVVVLYAFNSSGYNTNQSITIDQPVPFSHEHHVAGLGIDCRYCHTSVERSAFAGIPPSATCMGCHKLIWKDSPMLEPVRQSYKTGVPIRWTRVHDLPDFVYFNHSIHVAKGIGCATCHGRVDEMPLMRQVASLQMQWCLDCHRHPERYLRPRDQVFNLRWEAADQEALGRKLKTDYAILDAATLTSCSTCHR